MNAPVPSPMRRGACPGLSAPMATGDGLLARLMPSGATIALPAFRGLCDAAARHGNGIIEITSRGSIQVRGLTAASAGPFAADVAALGIPAAEGIPVLPDPLSDLDDLSVIDAGVIAGELRRALAASALASKLPAKVSVIVDGGGALHLDDVVADVRLRAVRTDQGVRVHVGLGGTAASAMSIGAVALHCAVECAVHLLDLLAAFSPQRMRNAVEDAGAARFISAMAGILEPASTPAARPAADPVGVHALRSGAVVGVALPFGHSGAENLSRLIGEVECAGAAGVRTAPGRALLFVNLRPAAADAFAARAATLGFIADPADPRRKVIACAGAPICASGQIPARALAPAVAQAVRAANVVGPVHVSGCAKGCAHQVPVPLAIFGRAGACDIHWNGKLVSSVNADALAVQLERLLPEEVSR
ncbi:MAG: precorrin-3B synthase [Xanthobacteraceae bacterium]|nr:precorrin-3B synthase [Xanthobacteraceae bacterium]